MLRYWGFQMLPPPDTYLNTCKNKENREWVVCNFWLPNSIISRYFIHWKTVLEGQSGAASKGQKHQSSDLVWTGLFVPQIPIPHFSVRSQFFLLEIFHFFVLPTELSFPRAMLAGNIFLPSISYIAFLSLLHSFQMLSYLLHLPTQFT